MGNMRLHELKILECFADAVYAGEKTFEIRDNRDRGFQKGDRIQFTVIGTDGIKVPHALHSPDCTFEITYVLPYYGLQEGYVALAIRKVIKKSEEGA